MDIGLITGCVGVASDPRRTCGCSLLGVVGVAYSELSIYIYTQLRVGYTHKLYTRNSVHC